MPDLYTELDPVLVEQARKQRLESSVDNSNPLLEKTVPKPVPSTPCNHDIAGYMPGRAEFEMEAEDEAEKPIQEIAFENDDSKEDVGKLHFLLCQKHQLQLYTSSSLKLDRLL